MWVSGYGGAGCDVKKGREVYVRVGVSCDRSVYYTRIRLLFFLLDRPVVIFLLLDRHLAHIRRHFIADPTQMHSLHGENCAVGNVLSLRYI